jgi:O-antigen ligase
MTAVMGSQLVDRIFDPARAARHADRLAVAVAASLPWSTSATGLLVVIWLIALLPTINLNDLRAQLAHPAGGVPVVFAMLMLLGVLWADATVAERIAAAKAYAKLLLIPLFMLQFRRSDRGDWVVGAFLASCMVLLVASWIQHAFPILTPRGVWPGVPVKSYLVQNTEFLICAFAVGHLGIAAWRRGQRAFALALAALAIAFLANLAFVVTARATLVAFPVLLVLFALQCFGWRGTVSVVVAGSVFAGIVWMASSHLRMRAGAVLEEVQQYRQENAENSSGFRLAFWKTSLGFVAASPIVGHGVGSIEPMFRKVTAGQTGAAGTVTSNAHNQTLEVAVQTGLIGVSLLYAMWIAHILLFWRGGLAAWLGMAVVVNGLVGSLFLSYLTDFSTGWIYVLGVGVLGGMVQKEVSRSADARDTTASAGPRCDAPVVPAV